VFKSPRSYTGDDTVEFSTHGGLIVPESIVAVVLRAGARQAYPGEFTRRALLNGRLDLVQAEAIGDLIDATSDAMRRVVLHQLDGSLSRQIEGLRSAMLDVEALLAYDIDFPEEDHGPISHHQISSAVARIQELLRQLLDTAPATELVRDGAIVVIAGRPNVGKSSLFNAVVGEHRAIVTDIPGTTRDAIEARVQMGNWPIRLVDTAGLRTTDELVERLGIEVSERYLSSAHVIVACDDDLLQLDQTIQAVRFLGSAPVLPVLTKVDAHESPTQASHEGRQTPREGHNEPKPVHVSARTRSGLQELGASLESILTERYGSIPVTQPALTRVRQRIAVEQASNELTDFQRLWERELLPASVAAVHVRTAVAALDELIGAVDTEDVLDRLFATFCIGK
jgi:tRNA modification GTPase